MRFGLSGAAVLLLSGVAGGQRPDSIGVIERDTVRLWSRQLRLKDARAVVTRLSGDSLEFVAPAGWRRSAREMGARLPLFERIEVLNGRRRSMMTMAEEAAIGAVGGAVVGAVTSYLGIRVLFELTAETGDQLTRDDIRRTIRPGAQIGAGLFFIGGAIDGIRAQEKWRRVR